MWDRITSFIKSRSKKASCQAQRTDNGLEQSQNILEVPPSIALDHLTAQLESVEQPSDLSCMGVQTMPRNMESEKIINKTALPPSTSVSTSANMNLLRDGHQSDAQMTSEDVGEAVVHAFTFPTTTTTSSINNGTATDPPASTLCEPVTAIPGARGLDDPVPRIPKPATADNPARPFSTAAGIPGLTNNLLLHENNTLPAGPTPSVTITASPRSKKVHVRGSDGCFSRAIATATHESAQSDAAEHLPPTHSSRKRGPPAQGSSSRSFKHQKRNTSTHENLVQAGELQDEDVSMSDDGETNHGGMTVEEFERDCPKTAAAARESQDGDRDEQMPQRPSQEYNSSITIVSSRRNSNEAVRSTVSIEEGPAVPLFTRRGRNEGTRQQSAISSRSYSGFITSPRRSGRLTKNSDQSTATTITASQAEHFTVAPPNIAVSRGAVAHDGDENSQHDASKKKAKRSATMKPSKSLVDSSKPFGGPHLNPDGLDPEKNWYPDYIITRMKVDGRFHVGVAWEKGPNGEPYLPTWEPQTAFQSNIVMRRYYSKEAKKEKDNPGYKRDLPDYKGEKDKAHWPKLVLRE